MFIRFKIKPAVVVLLLILFSLTLNCWRLNIFPKVWVDEPWNSIASYHLVTEGVLRNDVLSARENSSQIMLAPALVQSLAIAPVFALAGLGIWQARLPSVLMGVLVVVLTFLLARRYGIAIAVVSSVFVAFDNLVFVSARTVRQEIFVAAFALCAFLLLFTESGNELKKVRIFLAGVVLGVGLYVHPNFLLVAVSLLFINMLLSKSGQKARSSLWLIFGMALGVLPYVIYVVRWDVGTGFQVLQTQLMDRAKIFTHTGNFVLSTWGRELERYASYIFFPYRLPIFLTQAAAVIFALRRRDRLDKAILIIIFVHFVLFPLLISYRTSRYLTVLMPFMTILVVKMVWNIAGWSFGINWHDSWSAIKKLRFSALGAMALAMVFFANQLGGDAWAMWRANNCAYSPLIKQIREIVPPDARVWGTMTFWFGFYDHPYHTQFSDNLASFQPEYVILYDNEIWGNRTGVTGREDPDAALWQPLRNQLTALVAERGTCVGAVPNACYGNIQIFRLDWEK